MRILVVDADTATATSLATQCGKEHEVYTASDSASALLWACRMHPRLVLLKADLRLELAHRVLQAKSELGDIKLVLYDSPRGAHEVADLLGGCT